MLKKEEKLLHELERKFQMPASEILDVVLKNNRCLMNLKGAVAQEHLARYLNRLKTQRKIQDFGQIDEDGKPDFWVKCKGMILQVECKNVQKIPKGRDQSITVDFWKTRYQKTQGPISRFYHESEFQVLAACLFNRTGEWKFRFIRTRTLPRHPDDSSRFSNKVSLESNTPYGREWRDDLPSVLRQLV